MQRNASKIGRPAKFSAEAAAAVVEAVRKGCPRGTAANAAGLGRSTLMRWMARGKAERRGQFRDFWDDIKRAEAEAIAERIERIRDAADSGKWQAAAWWLERMHPDVFGSDRRTVRELKKMILRLTAPATCRS